MGHSNYAVVLDAGSSGTRVYVYKWKAAEDARKKASGNELKRLPKIKTEDTKKVHPGISTFADKPDRVGPDHLKPLFKHALDQIPQDDAKHTPLFLLATAGMRLVPDHERKVLLDEICSYARENTKLQLPDCDLHIQVIPGETEGLYGWIAANYLMEGFDEPENHDHGKGHHTYGFLDMGGASAQIAFAPNNTEAKKHANDLKLLRLRTLDGQAQEYRVFTSTWLGFGANESRRRYVKALKGMSKTGALEILDPCLPRDLRLTEDGLPIEKGSDEAKGSAPYLLGTGDFTDCLKKTYPLLEKDAPCLDDPCLLSGVHVPSIDFDVNHFIGVSEYWHTTHEIFEMNYEDKSYDLATYQQRVDEFCSRHWDDITADVFAHKWGKKVDESTAERVCFKASWLINVLHDGIGIPRVGLEGDMKGGHNGTKEVLDKAKKKGYLDPFQPVNKIDGEEVSWTLGKAVLYASSQIPPTDETLAVGFGTNSLGMPTDWQSPGGVLDHDDDDLYDKLFKDSPRRIPGVVIFLLIVALAAYLLCGRNRRSSKFSRTPGGAAGSRRRRLPLGIHNLPGAGKLFGHAPSGPVYDRLETGDMSDDDVELPDLGSLAGSDDSRSGTPQLLPSALGFNRGNLLSRVDSRERIQPVSSSLQGSPRRSRTASPARAPFGLGLGVRSPVLGAAFGKASLD